MKVRLAEVLVAEDGRVDEGHVEPSLGDVAVGLLGEVDVVPALVVGRVFAGVRPRFAALGGQVEVVLTDAWRPAAHPRRLFQEPYAIIRDCDVCACRQDLSTQG
jgi:hypothetical protein